MPTLERQGASIRYEVSGEGPAVLLGHSLLCGRWMWDGVAPRLAERHRVINLEFRGHGGSTAPAPFTLDDLVDDQLAVLDAEGVERAALVGLSMGGMTAMRLALRAPERVGALVLIDSNAAAETRSNRLKYGLLALLYRRLGFNRLLVRSVAPIMLGRTTVASRPELVERLAARVREHQREPLIRAIRAVVGRTATGGLEAIRHPTLVMVGDEDRATPPPRSEDIHRRIPGARLLRIPEAGHLSAFEQPDLVAAATLDFLAGCSW